MSGIKRDWDILTDEKRRYCINEIISFFRSERDETIGNIAAEQILDFILEIIGKDFYNKGVEDSMTFLRNGLSNLEIDMESLLKK